ncbi:MAG TPA: tricarballylate utilization 4Fe-4S protein TcuB [Burkholderiaceae bacterium]|nr:tricarballylate utilization 4Fe-4S protein TcuB [Burkholderiaceae bacterium]
MVAQAAADAGAAAPEAEVQRVLQICNACRYCEGFCAVFPAMTRRLEFPLGDVHYLANLCHHCGACLHACQYAPPHDFGVNVPRAMARVRDRTYAVHAWPASLGRLYEHQGATLAVALVLGLALVLALTLWHLGGVAALWRVPGAAGFYEVLPHGLMVSLFAPVFAFALLALGVGVARFWRGAVPQARGAGADAVAEAARDVLSLKYLDGGHGQGCHNEDDAWTLARRRAHHAAFYGFALCFAATGVATLYHYGLGWPAPYGWTSLPKLLGVSGGLALLAGCAGLWWLNRRRHPLHALPEQRTLDRGFIALLALTAASGLLLAAARTTPAVPVLLCLHLGAVLALFLTLPYGKFAHAVYRSAALLKWALEKRQPLGLSLGGE